MIRRATAQDAEAVLHVHRESRRVAYAHLAPPELAVGPGTVESWTAAIERSTTWVAEEDDQVVGFASLEDGALRGLYVLPAYAGRGIGATLHDLAVDAGARSLWVYVDNPDARAFYERRGWVGESDSAYVDQDWAVKEPAMRYRLDRP